MELQHPKTSARILPLFT